MIEREISESVRIVDNFPVPGVQFFDVTPLCSNKKLFKKVIRHLAKPFLEREIDCVVGAESRGYFFASALAYELDCAFAPARKPNKLPFDKFVYKYVMEDMQGIPTSDIGGSVSAVPTTYEKEYKFEMHQDAVARGQNVLFVDDLLAKGGTAAACCHLIEKLGGHVVSCLFVIELQGLGGAARIAPRAVHRLVQVSSSRS